jgi:hypothetical protein
MGRVAAIGGWVALTYAATVWAQSDANHLQRSGSISGRVVDGSGAPVSAVIVETRRWGSSGREALLLAGGNKATTDEQGRFLLSGIIPGEYALQAAPALDPFPQDPARRPSGFGVTYYPNVIEPESAWLVTVDPRQAVDGIDIVLANVRLASIVGQVFDADGHPLNRAPVRATRHDELMSCGTLVASQTDGSFAIPNLPPGRYEVVLELPPHPGQPFQDARLTVVIDGDDIAIRLMPMRFETISGSIRFDDPVAARSVKPAAIQLVSVPTDLDGEPHATPLAHIRDDFSFDLDVPRGPVALRVFAPGWALNRVRVHGKDVTDIGFDAASEGRPDDVQVELTNRRQGISGVVRDAPGASAQQFAVLAFADDRTKWRSPLARYIAWTVPNDTRRYAIDTLPPGDYWVVALDRPAADWHDPALLAALRPYATRITLYDQRSENVDLRLSSLPGWVRLAGPSYGIGGSIMCGGPPPRTPGRRE